MQAVTWGKDKQEETGRGSENLFCGGKMSIHDFQKVEGDFVGIGDLGDLESNKIALHGLADDTHISSRTE
jgi:hypothetical protein